MAYGVEEGEGLAGGLALAAAVAGDEEALHAGAQRVRPLPHRLPVGEELALPPTTLGAAARVRLAIAAGGHLFSRVLLRWGQGYCGGRGRGRQAGRRDFTPSQRPALENCPIAFWGGFGRFQSKF